MRLIQFGSPLLMMVAAAVCLLALLPACTGKQIGSPAPLLPPQDEPVSIDLVKPAGTEPPANAPEPSLLTLRASSSTFEGTHRSGEEFDPDLPNHNVFSNIFDPSSYPGEPSLAEDYASATYRFTGVNAAVAPYIFLNWENLEFPPGPLPDSYVRPEHWVGLANWEADRWDWYGGGDSRSISFESLEPYLATDGTVVVMLMVSGNYHPQRLKSIRIGVNHPSRVEMKSHYMKTDYWPRGMAMEIGSDGIPVIAVGRNRMPGIDLIRLNGDDWETETVSTGEDQASVSSMVLDDSDAPRILYHNQSNNRSFILAYDGEHWSRLPNPDFWPAGGTETLTIDPSGRLCLPLRHTYKLYQAVYQDEEWTYDLITKDGNQLTTFLYDQAGNPTTYYLNSHNLLNIASKKDGFWHVEQIWDEPVGEVWMALDGMDSQHLLFHNDPWLNFKGYLRHARHDGRDWTINRVDPTDPYTSQPRIQLADNGYPVAAYSDYTNGETVLAFWTGSAWHLETLTNRTVGWYFDLEIGEDGSIWLAESTLTGVNLYQREAGIEYNVQPGS